MVVNTSATATADRYKGFCMALINELASGLNFRSAILLKSLIKRIGRREQLLAICSLWMW